MVGHVENVVGLSGRMMKMIKLIDKIGPYKILAVLWIIVGLLVLISGEITRIEYGCVWAILVLEYIDKALKEKDDVKN